MPGPQPRYRINDVRSPSHGRADVSRSTYPDSVTLDVRKYRFAEPPLELGVIVSRDELLKALKVLGPSPAPAAEPESDYAEVIAENERLSDKLSKALNERDDAQKTLAVQTAALHREKKDHEGTTQYLRSAERDRASARRKRDQLEEVNHELSESLALARKDLDESEKECDSLQRQLDATERELTEIRAARDAALDEVRTARAEAVSGSEEKDNVIRGLREANRILLAEGVKVVKQRDKMRAELQQALRARDATLEAEREAPRPRDDAREQERLDRYWAMDKATELAARLVAVGLDADRCAEAIMPTAEWILDGKEADHG